MQGYTYSVFSFVAIAIFLIINFDLLVRRGVSTLRGRRYRSFLMGILAYYVTDAAWGALAGLGSTFSACIPNVTSVAERAVASAAPKSAVAPKKRPEHVLVVDDSSVNRAVLTAHLKRSGIVSIDQAGDGEEALAKLYASAQAGRPYDIVFSDLWMPKMNGLELIGKVRDDSRFVHLPVYAVTADTEARQDARTDFFTGLLFKPITYDKLAEILAHLAS